MDGKIVTLFDQDGAIVARSLTGSTKVLVARLDIRDWCIYVRCGCMSLRFLYSGGFPFTCNARPGLDQR